MQWITNFLTGLKSLSHKQQVENELDEELESYLQASAAEKEKSGMTPEKARRAALRRFSYWCRGVARRPVILSEAKDLGISEENQCPDSSLRSE